MDYSEALEILGLPPTATPDEIKQAYRDLAKVWHPDRFGNDARLRAKAEETLKRINEAYRGCRGARAVAQVRHSRRPVIDLQALAPPNRRLNLRDQRRRLGVFTPRLLLAAAGWLG